MRLDHVAYRVADRKKTAQFFIDAFGYKIQEEFTINFENGTCARCIALEPPEKASLKEGEFFPWTHTEMRSFYRIAGDGACDHSVAQEYHIPPEIFVSDGEPGSVVGKWVERRNGIGGVHHMAYQVDDVRATMLKWAEKGWATFTTDEVLTCPDDELHQIFTKPSPLTGVIYEFIRRGEHGFCQANVKNLMDSTKELE